MFVNKADNLELKWFINLTKTRLTDYYFNINYLCVNSKAKDSKLSESSPS